MTVNQQGNTLIISLAILLLLSLLAINAIKTSKLEGHLVYNNFTYYAKYLELNAALGYVQRKLELLDLSDTAFASEQCYSNICINSTEELPVNLMAQSNQWWFSNGYKLNGSNSIPGSAVYSVVEYLGVKTHKKTKLHAFVISSKFISDSDSEGDIKRRVLIRN